MRAAPPAQNAPMGQLRAAPPLQKKPGRAEQAGLGDGEVVGEMVRELHRESRRAQSKKRDMRGAQGAREKADQWLRRLGVLVCPCLLRRGLGLGSLLLKV